MQIFELKKKKQKKKRVIRIPNICGNVCNFNWEYTNGLLIQIFFRKRSRILFSRSSYFENANIISSLFLIFVQLTEIDTVWRSCWCSLLIRIHLTHVSGWLNE